MPVKKAAKAKALQKPSPRAVAKKSLGASHATAPGDGEWRGAALARVRGLIQEAVPGLVEEIKWRKPSNPAGVPVWQSDGIICTGETYRDKVKLTFAKGASLDDPAGLFNGDDKGATRRSIDIRVGSRLNERAFKALVRAAAALNRADKPAKKKPQSG